MPTVDELMELARTCAGRLDLTDAQRPPTLEDVEQDAEGEFEALLDVLQEDAVFGGVDLERQQHLTETIASRLPDAEKRLIEELVEQHTRYLWLMQEAAYHVGLTVGMKLGERREA